MRITFEEFLADVETMREYQKEFLRTHRKVALHDAKRWELRVDADIKLAREGIAATR